MTTITLPADIEAWAREAVSAGRAASVEEFVAASLREQRELFDAHRALVMEAYDSLARGEVVEEAEMEAKFERWLAEDPAEE